VASRDLAAQWAADCTFRPHKTKTLYNRHRRQYGIRRHFNGNGGHRRRDVLASPSSPGKILALPGPSISRAVAANAACQEAPGESWSCKWMITNDRLKKHWIAE
jgi:hypothetical protein